MRAGSAEDKKAYKAALGFEQMLLGQLVKEMLPKDAPLAEGPYAAPMQDALDRRAGRRPAASASPPQLYQEMQEDAS